MGWKTGPAISAFSSSVLTEIERQCPTDLAVVQLADDDKTALQLSFAQLSSWANVISAQIEAARPEAVACGDDSNGIFLVALVLDRSALALAAILAVWKAGGAYAPVPKDAPLARRKLLCSQADMVLTDIARFAEMHAHSCTLLLSEPRTSESCFSVPGRQPPSDEMCMVIYTSGSTGQPKGVLCDHRCLWHSVCCFAKDIGATNRTRLLWKTPYQWRTAEYELFAALCFGGTLYIAPEGSHRRVPYLMEVAETHSITAFSTVPSVLPLLVEHLGKSSLKHMASVGEALPSELCRPFLLDNAPVLRNYYGLTETGMTSWRCSHFPNGSVAPVGQPQPEVQVTLLQPSGQPGQEGEVYFSGIMSRGYLKMPELTRERYHEVHGEYCFQTGDFGRWKGGQLEICGRKDAQVKLNGIRIELAEIEACLSAVCKEAAVVQAMEDSQTLVAFVAGAQKDLADFLLQQLPLYMIPVHFIHVDCLPRLANDKVDRSLLRARTQGLQSKAQAEAKLAGGETDNEAELTKILDSLGFERLLSAKQMEMQRVCDNLSVVAMVNVILFHWFWCVLIEPETYPLGHAHDGVAMPKLEVSGWVLYFYRLATQDWAYGVFMFAAAQMSPKQKRFTSFFPMILSQFFHSPWNDMIFYAETVQRWFLLALFLGRAILVGGCWCGAGPMLQLVPLLCLYLLVPSCFSCGLDWCQAGGEYFLPTDWWPECRSCLMTPKVLLSSLLYVFFSHFAPSCATLMRKTSAPVAASLFIVASVVSEKLPMAQRAIEGDMELEPTLCASLRIVGLLLILLQTVCLACAARVMLWHLRWPAKYLMGSYLLNLNFLDAFFISPGVRRHILEKVQAVNVGPLRGICLWATMLVPIVLFMFFAAPVLQTLLITWPWWIVSSVARAAQSIWTSTARGCEPRAATSSKCEPLLGHDSLSTDTDCSVESETA